MANKTTKPAKATTKPKKAVNITDTDYDRWSDGGGAVKPIGTGIYGRSKGTTPKKGK